MAEYLVNVLFEKLDRYMYLKSEHQLIVQLSFGVPYRYQS